MRREAEDFRNHENHQIEDILLADDGDVMRDLMRDLI